MPSLLIVGDSQAAGPMGARLEADFQHAGWTTTRMGEVGWTADRWISDRPTDVVNAAAGTDLVLVVLGTNDIYKADRTLPSAQWFKNLRPNVWWVGAPNYNDPNLQARVNATMAVYVPLFGPKYIDSRQFTQPTCTGRTPDCIHFLGTPGAAWGDAVYNYWRSHSSSASTSGGISIVEWLAPTVFALGLLAVFVAWRSRRLRPNRVRALAR